MATDKRAAQVQHYGQPLMPNPSPSEWSFDELAKADVERSKRLEASPAFESIVAQVQGALTDALRHGDIRYGSDCYQGFWRAILQFRVSSELYDIFFNARSGYRAQFWISPERGIAANSECLDVALRVVSAAIPDRIDAREIETRDEPYVGRQDMDVGGRELSGDFLVGSLSHSAAKIWICERLISGKKGPLQATPFYSGERLSVMRWPTAIASYPCPEWTWLDIKGGFVGGRQPKDPYVRAQAIYLHGYS